MSLSDLASSTAPTGGDYCLHMSEKSSNESWTVRTVYLCKAHRLILPFSNVSPFSVRSSLFYVDLTGGKCGKLVFAPSIISVYSSYLININQVI